MMREFDLSVLYTVDQVLLSAAADALIEYAVVQSNIVVLCSVSRRLSCKIAALFKGTPIKYDRDKKVWLVIEETATCFRRE